MGFDWPQKGPKKEEGRNNNGVKNEILAYCASDATGLLTSAIHVAGCLLTHSTHDPPVSKNLWPRLVAMGGEVITFCPDIKVVVGEMSLWRCRRHLFSRQPELFGV